MSRCLFRAVCASLICLVFQAPPLAAAQDEPLTLYVFDRPPYYRLRNGQPAGGFLLDLSLAVLDHSAIPYVVRELPAARVTATFANEVVNACGTGWFRTPEREGFARFSTPLYQDRPLVAAVNASAGACPESTTLARLLDEKKHWGLRGGFSYGPAIDARLAALPDDRIHRFNDAAAMLALVARGRLDAMLIEPEELAWLVGRHPEYAGTVCALALEDAPPGNGRHIMCDASVSPDTMARIDAAIVEFVGEDAQRARCLVALRH